MPECVNCDCRPGDVINTLDRHEERRNARVIDTFPKGVRCQFNDDDEPVYRSYQTLHADRAQYAAKCEPVQPPRPWSW